MKKVLILLSLISLIFSQEWVYDLDKAKLKAKQENKSIILVFQGSDWCAPCMKLEKKIWRTDAFIEFAKSNYIMLKADFPRKEENALSPEQKSKNEKLAEMYNLEGYFPFVVLLNPEGIVLGQTSYKKLSPEDYIKHLEELRKSK